MHCDLCLTDEDQHAMVACARCGTAFHAYCLEDYLGREKGVFFCDQCGGAKKKVKKVEKMVKNASRKKGKVEKGLCHSSGVKGLPERVKKGEIRRKRPSPAKKVYPKRARSSKHTSAIPPEYMHSGYLSALSPIYLDSAGFSAFTEEKLLRQAIEASRLTASVKIDLKHIPEVPTFHPSPKEFLNPIRYIRSLHQIGQKWGVVKIVPPRNWSPGFHIDPENYSFKTRKQHVHKLQEAIGFDDGKLYTLSSYREMARSFEKQYLKDLGIKFGSMEGPKESTESLERERQTEDIERKYWQIVKGIGPQAVVEYGNDVDSLTVGSGFDREKKWRPGSGSGAWNLNRIAHHEESPLRLLPKNINGVTVPWVYCGMLFSSFCWHCEDNHLPSINYLHKGAPKLWYAAPCTSSKTLEKAMKKHMPILFYKEPDLMQKLVTMLDPPTLIAHGVPVSRAVQREGNFIVTFPRGYHCGFNTGFNVAEAVNLAYDEWFPYGRQCIKRYREMKRPSVFSHEWLLITYARQSNWENNEPGKKLLKQELKQIFDEENRMRKKARKAGVKKIIKMKNDSKNTNGNENCRQCHLCKKHCFLTHMGCFCPNQHKVVCLNHISYLCACNPSNKALYCRNIDINADLDSWFGAVEGNVMRG